MYLRIGIQKAKLGLFAVTSFLLAGVKTSTRTDMSR